MLHDHRLARELRRKNAGERADDQIEIKALRAALETRDAEIKAFAEKAASEIKDLGRMNADTKAALTQLSEAGTALQAHLQAVEQKLARRGGGGDGPAIKSLGERFAESDDFKRLQEKKKGTASIEVKAVTSITSATTGDGAAGVNITPQRLPFIVRPGERALTIRDLMLPGRTSSSSIEYVRESGFTNGAAPVEELALKPQSDLEFELLSTPVRTIAHWMHASKQVLDDVPMLQSYIDGRLRYGLALVEEGQILAGDGTGQNLLGIVPQASPYAFATRSKATDTKIDRVRRAILQVRLALFRATAIVMNPIDWADIETQKDEIGRYMIGNPQTGATPTLWRLPVVESDAIAPGKFLTGAFDLGAQIFDREDANVQVSTEDRNNFVTNSVTILAEERLAFAVTRPESFVYGNLVDGNAS